MGELISIIVPVYNVEKYVSICINSLIDQSYRNLEIIIVDDGSTDNSGKICDSIAQIDKRIEVIHKKNGGQSEARNFGLEKATGKYIAFVDSDDYVDKYFVENLYELIKKYNVDIAMCKYKDTLTDNDTIVEKEKYENIIFNQNQAIKELLLFGNVDNYIWNKLYKREIFKNMRFEVGKTMEDLGIMYKLLYNSANIAMTDYCGYFYRKRQNSTMSNVSLELIVNTKNMVNKRYEELKVLKPQLVNVLNINRLTFIKYYFEDLGKIEKINIDEFKDEYKFYKQFYMRYRKDIRKTTSSIFRKADFDILYVNKNLFIKICWLKKKIKQLMEKK